MDKYLLVKPFIKMMGEGKTFTSFFFWFLRILAALSLIGLIFISIQLWSNIPFKGGEVNIIFIAFIAQILLAVLVYVIINILLLRADDIKVLTPAPDFILIPVTIIFVKMLGEILGTFYAFIGIVTGIAIWALGPLLHSLPSIPGMDLFSGNVGFAGGLIAICGGPVIGFLALCTNYLLAELFQIVVDFLRKTER